MDTTSHDVKKKPLKLFTCPMCGKSMFDICRVGHLVRVHGWGIRQADKER